MLDTKGALKSVLQAHMSLTREVRWVSELSVCNESLSCFQLREIVSSDVVGDCRDPKSPD